MLLRMTTTEDVLTFWFGEAAKDEAELMQQVRRWFMGGFGMDAEVVERFGVAVDAAVAGELDGWAATSRGRMVLVLLLDQLTRNAYRGDGKTYAGNARAQRLCLEAFDRGFDKELSFVERLFLSMPLLHSEHAAHHERLAVLARDLQASAPPLYQKMCAMQAEQVAKYADIIRRYGRFPHRNELLGRTSTEEEKAFLVDWAQRQPPSGASSI